MLLAVLLAGMGGAAWQMAHRGLPDGPRDLTVLAAEGAEIALDGQTSRIPVTQGVHAFSVTPGAHTLTLSLPTGRAIERTLTVPKGIGPLMIAADAGADGTLQIGYY
jgi:hypothetical protein